MHYTVTLDILVHSGDKSKSAGAIQIDYPKTGQPSNVRFNLNSIIWTPELLKLRPWIFMGLFEVIPMNNPDSYNSGTVLIRIDADEEGVQNEEFGELTQSYRVPARVHHPCIDFHRYVSTAEPKNIAAQTGRWICRLKTISKEEKKPWYYQFF